MLFRNFGPTGGNFEHARTIRDDSERSYSIFKRPSSSKGVFSSTNKNNNTIALDLNDYEGLNWYWRINEGQNKATSKVKR